MDLIIYVYFLLIYIYINTAFCILEGDEILAAPAECLLPV